MPTTSLHLDHDPDMIWTHGEDENHIGLRFDCGDAGKVILNRERTQELIKALKQAQFKMGWTGTEVIQ